MNNQLKINEKDENNDEILLSKDHQQIMMEWEKPYMEASIDFLSPKGDVLEIGFGCGYSASQIMKYPIKSYTIIEISPNIIEKIKKWREKYSDISINIIEGSWQEKLSLLGKFDEIYFDDFPLNITKDSSQLEIQISNKRMNLFIDQCIKNHTKIGSKICFYLNGNDHFSLSSDSEPFIKKEFKEIDVKISELCKYRDLSEQKCTIPLITKVKDFSLADSQKYARKQFQKSMGKTVCLNMIVKNESKIIADTLENLCSYIHFDYWVISDTGSTDDTKNIIIDFFQKEGISGELIENEWKDFGHNRTIALNYAYNKTDYLFLFDADDKIMGSLQIPLILNKDKYFFKFGIDSYLYHRPNLISNRIRWKFKGILHEFLTNIDPINQSEIIDGNYIIKIGINGARFNTLNKYLKDANKLEIAFQEENEDLQLKHRYAFYCAQSYRDCNNYKKAIEWYLKVLNLSNWNQEKYYACLQLGNLYNIEKREKEMISILSLASQFDSERIEAATLLMSYYFLNNNHLIVNSIYNKFKNITAFKNSEKLFIDLNSRDKMEFYNSISAYYVKDMISGYESCKYLLLKDKDFNITIKNLFFYLKEFKHDNNKNKLSNLIREISINQNKNIDENIQKNCSEILEKMDSL